MDGEGAISVNATASTEAAARLYARAKRGLCVSARAGRAVLFYTRTPPSVGDGRSEADGLVDAASWHGKGQGGEGDTPV